MVLLFAQGRHTVARLGGDDKSAATFSHDIAKFFEEQGRALEVNLQNLLDARLRGRYTRCLNQVFDHPLGSG